MHLSFLSPLGNSFCILYFHVSVKSASQPLPDMTGGRGPDGGLRARPRKPRRREQTHQNPHAGHHRPRPRAAPRPPSPGIRMIAINLLNSALLNCGSASATEKSYFSPAWHQPFEVVALEAWRCYIVCMFFLFGRSSVSGGCQHACLSPRRRSRWRTRGRPAA